MTREEAIKIIEVVFQSKEAYKYYDSVTHQALDMAIEALEQVTGKLNNPDNSLLTADSEACKEQKSKLDLISRAEAIEALGEEPPVWCDEDYEIAERDQWRADIEAIKSVPSADRPRGEWVSRSGCYGVAYCSECNYELRVNNTNFCPNCGADMRGENG